MGCEVLLVLLEPRDVLTKALYLTEGAVTLTLYCWDIGSGELLVAQSESSSVIITGLCGAAPGASAL
jgi:hypothetical protein